jgi:hypothetical protein
MTKATAAELLDLIIERAPRLRSAGVRAVEIENVSFDLAPADPPDVSIDIDDEDDAPRDALHDPHTYGRRKRVPGRQRREEPQS